MLPRRSLLAPLLALLALAAAGAAPAAARPAPQTLKKSIWGPLTLPNGKSAFPVYRDLGAKIYQLRVTWPSIAPVRPVDPTNPADPSYQWGTEVDQAVREARRHGMRVALTVGFTPAWANGGRSINWAPDRPEDFADFVTAASKRWPGVRYWLIWGEPTRRDNFLPNPPASQTQAPAKATPKHTLGARTYARILDASYGALKRVRRSNLVIGGNAFVTGDVGALNWIRWMRLPSRRPPRMDFFGFNPFTARKPDLRGASPIRPGLADFSDLDLLARWLDRYQRRDGRRLKLFLSEFQVPTAPNYEFDTWRAPKVAAQWIAAALRITRRWNRIYTFGYHTLTDEAPNGKTGEQAEVKRGLMDWRGRKKPGYWAYKRG